MKFEPLLKYAPLTKNRVKNFQGTRKYLKTGNLKDDCNIEYDLVNFNDKPSRADILACEGDILFARMKDTEKVLFIDKNHDNLIVSTGFAVLQPKSEFIHSHYLSQYLKSKTFSIEKNKLCSGSTQKAITDKSISKLKIPIPETYEDQVRIANLLTQAENLIAKRKKSIEYLDELLKSTFLEMFGDPVRNEKGWDIVSLKEMCIRIIDCPHSTPQYSDMPTSLFCIRSADIQNGYLDLSSTLQVDRVAFEKRNQRYEPVFNDIVFTREGGRLGNSARIPKDTSVCLGQRVMLFSVNREIACSEYLWVMLNSKTIRQKINNLVGGGAAPRVNIKDLINLQILLPPLPLQNQFAEIVEKVEKIKKKYEISLQELENLYGSLSQLAFKGEL